MISRHTLRIATLVVTALAALVTSATIAGRAAASQTQISIIEDDTQLAANPAATLLRMRQIGASAVRLSARWAVIAPKPNSFKRPSRFNPASPASYPASAWTLLDTEVRDATADGITVNLDAEGGAPLWATGPGMPKTPNCPCHSWAPQDTQFGYFVRALATRYSGNYDPHTGKLAPGNAVDLPRVSFWSIWNEPNYGPSLAPQALPGQTGVEDAPAIDRGLVDAGWSALQATGHGSDTILFGDVAPRGSASFGNFNGMLPLVFLRALYCVGANYRPLRGTAASLRGCPTNAAGSSKFAAQNPALFKASGFADHPYTRYFPPNQELNADPVIPGFAFLSANFASLALIGQLETGLNRVLGVYGSKRLMPVYSTEFGYQTDPPKRQWKKDPTPYISQATAAYYDNWAEYVSWKDPRIASFDQYLLEDSFPALASNNYGSYASGLINYGGKPKPGLAAWRMPIYLPHTTAGPGHALEVWGAVRPVHFTRMDFPYYDFETVKIMFAPVGSSQSKILDTVPISSPEGYFDTKVPFDHSGTVWLSWTYPGDDPLLGDSGQQAVSRQVHVTVN
ncbi:MAG: hypothetical protein ACLP8S_22015 [Solirubrobacteraceae bacterium]